MNILSILTSQYQSQSQSVLVAKVRLMGIPVALTIVPVTACNRMRANSAPDKKTFASRKYPAGKMINGNRIMINNGEKIQIGDFFFKSSDSISIFNF
jgi:hypothetical protein